MSHRLQAGILALLLCVLTTGTAPAASDPCGYDPYVQFHDPSGQTTNPVDVFAMLSYEGTGCGVTSFDILIDGVPSADYAYCFYDACYVGAQRTLVPGPHVLTVEMVLDPGSGFDPLTQRNAVAFTWTIEVTE